MNYYPDAVLGDERYGALERRSRGFDREDGHLRTLGESRVPRPSRMERWIAAASRFARGEHDALTDYPCRLMDGRIGRTAIVLVDGEWMAVCAVA